MTEPFQLAGDVLISGYPGKLRVARGEKDSLQYALQTRKIQAVPQEEWEIVINDWSQGMGLSELHPGQQYTKRFYTSKDFDTSVTGVLRPRGNQGIIATPGVLSSPHPLAGHFEDRVGSTDYCWFIVNENGGGVAVCKVSLGAAPEVIETHRTGNADDRGGRPIKAYGATDGGERWFIPLSNGNRILRLGTATEHQDDPTVGALQTERMNSIVKVPDRMRGAGSTEPHSGGASTAMTWALDRGAPWAAAGVAVKDAAGTPPSPHHATNSIRTAVTISDVLTMSAIDVGGNNRYMVCLVAILNSAGQTVTGVEYSAGGGEALGLLGVQANGTDARVEIWGLVNATQSQADDVVVTLSADAVATAYCLALEDVHQGAPVGAIDSDTGSDAAPTSTPASNADDFCCDIVAVRDGDIWAVETGIVGGAQEFCRVGDIIWRGFDTNKLKSVAIGTGSTPNDFETDGNWGGLASVSHSDLAITGLASLGRSLYVGKHEGAFGSDPQGGILEMLPDISFDPNALVTKGAFLTAWHSKLWYPAGNQGLWRHNLYAARPRGPDTLPRNAGDVQNLAATEIRFGSHAGLAHTPGWMFVAYMPSGALCLLAAREAEEGDTEADSELIWHPILVHSAFGGSAEPYGLAVTWRGNNPRVWYASPTLGNIHWLDLSDDGSPYRPNSDRGTSTAAEMIQAAYDCGAPGVLKYIREGEIILRNGDANAAWRMWYYLEGGSPVALGAAVSTVGASTTTRYVTPGSNDTFYSIRPREQCAVSAALTDERAHCKSVTLRGGYLPDTGKRFVYVFDISQGQADSEGVVNEEPVETKLAALHALVMGQVRTLTDHRGKTYKVVVKEVNEVEPQSVGLNPVRSYAQVVMDEVEYS